LKAGPALDLLAYRRNWDSPRGMPWARIARGPWPGV